MGSYISREELEQFQPRYTYKEVLQANNTLKTIKKFDNINKDVANVCESIPKTRQKT
jgi:hypothetical protein